MRALVHQTRGLRFKPCLSQIYLLIYNQCKILPVFPAFHVDWTWQTFKWKKSNGSICLWFLHLTEICLSLQRASYQKPNPQYPHFAVKASFKNTREAKKKELHPTACIIQGTQYLDHCGKFNFIHWCMFIWGNTTLKLLLWKILSVEKMSYLEKEVMISDKFIFINFVYLSDKTFG